MSMKICTLNTWNCDGDYGARLRLMAAETARISPDILMLQENYAGEAGDTAGRLSEAMGGARVDIAPSGLAMLTKGDILSSRAVPLPAPEDDMSRFAQIVEIDCDGARVLAANTHLTYFLEADAIRRTQIETALAALPPLAGYEAAVMGGDFNCPPDSPAIRWLVENAGATDIVAAACADFTTRDFSSRYPPRRIDYLFLPDCGGKIRIDGATRVFDAPDPALGIFPSDHYGVLAELSIG
ncbi:MAG: endonuclease/exonuclease/phosphatase family protein [Rhodospirillaceae bacterium]